MSQWLGEFLKNFETVFLISTIITKFELFEHVFWHPETLISAFFVGQTAQKPVDRLLIVLLQVLVQLGQNLEI